MIILLFLLLLTFFFIYLNKSDIFFLIFDLYNRFIFFFEKYKYYICVFIYFTLFYFQFLKLIFSFTMFILIQKFKQLPSVIKYQDEIKKDFDTISYHWRNDMDLILVSNIVRSYYVISVACIFFSLYHLNGVPIEIMYLYLPTKQYYFESKLLLFGILVFYAGVFITFLLDLHIIFFRNPVTFKQAQVACVTCAKVVAVTLPVLHITSSTPLIEPNIVSNTYNIYSPVGRGYGFYSSVNQAQDTVLKSTSIYDRSKLVDSTTNMFSPSKLETFVQDKDNLKFIKKNLGVVQCQTLGVNKGTWY